MKHQKITALAPEKEDFQADTFITNEAGWLTTGHIDAIEAALMGNEKAAAEMQSKLDTAIADKVKAEGNVKAANTDKATAEAALIAANVTISELRAKVVTLGKTAAGDFQKTAKTDSDIIPGEVIKEDEFLTSVDAEKAKMKSWNEKKPTT